MSVLGRTKPLKNVTSLPCFWKTGSEKASDWSEPRRCLEDGTSQITPQKGVNFIRRKLNIEKLSVIWHSWWSEEMLPRKPRVFSSHWGWALSVHRGPELPQSLHSPLWSPSSSQLKALNSYYWAESELLTTCRYVRKINRKTNVHLRNQMLAIIATRQPTEHSVLQMWTLDKCIARFIFNSAEKLDLFETASRGQLWLSIQGGQSWLVNIKQIYCLLYREHRANAAVIWLKHILGSN